MAKTQTLAEALVKLRSELTNPPRNDKNPFFSSKYCKLESAISHIQTPLANSDLTFIQMFKNVQQIHSPNSACVSLKRGR